MEEKVDEKDLYRAMAWLLERQDKIERRLAKKHLSDSAPILYDLSSTYYEGSTCVLAQRGYSRDGKMKDPQSKKYKKYLTLQDLRSSCTVTGLVKLIFFKVCEKCGDSVWFSVYSAQVWVRHRYRCYP